MPYPESCPECGGTFRNSGSHFTARRNEVGRHVLLELGCQNTTARFWWDFTSGSLTDEGRTIPARRVNLAAAVSAASTNGSYHPEPNARGALATLDVPDAPPPIEDERPAELELEPVPELEFPPHPEPEQEARLDPPDLELPGQAPSAPSSLKDAFVRQLQLDRLTLRQMRSWLMADDARRAIEVAAGATEATYERLALILFGSELPQLLGKQQPAAAGPGMSAEDRLELQREKARIRARLRRAAAKAARQQL